MEKMYAFFSRLHKFSFVDLHRATFRKGLRGAECGMQCAGNNRGSAMQCQMRASQREKCASQREKSPAAGLAPQCGCGCAKGCHGGCNCAALCEIQRQNDAGDVILLNQVEQKQSFDIEKQRKRIGRRVLSVFCLQACDLWLGYVGV